MALSNREKLILKAKAELELRKRQQKPSFIQQVKQAAIEGVEVPAGVQRAAQIAEIPIRAGRATAVGLERATRGVGAMFPMGPTPQQTFQVMRQLPTAAQRTQAAFQPGFEPETPQEAIAGAVGETAAVTGLLAPIHIATAKHPAVAGAMTFGTLEAIHQAANEGRIEPLEVGKAAAIGGALPLVKPSIQLVRKSMKQLLKGAFKQSAQLPETSLDAILENPTLLREFEGTANTVRARVVNLQREVIKARQQAGNTLQKVKKSLGIDTPLDAPIQTVPSRTPEQLDNTFRNVKAVMETNMPKQQKLKQLVELRQEIDDALNFSKSGQTLQPVSGKIEAQFKNRRIQINNMIEQLSPRLRWAEKGYHKAAEVYDQLQRAMSTPGKAEQLMVRLFKGEPIDDVLGSLSDFVNALRRVEKIAGKSLVKPVLNELSAKSLREITPHGFSGSILAGIAGVLALTQRPALAAAVAASSSPRAVAATLPAAQKIGRLLQKIGNIISSPTGRAAIAGLTIQSKKGGER